MDKRYLRWILPVALISLLVAQFVARPDWRAFASIEFWESILRYSRVLRLVESEYVHGDDVNFHDLTDRALRSVAGSLDRYSGYLTPDDYVEYARDANQEYVGVGVEISHFGGRVFISQVFEQGSAASGGVLAGDTIVSIDGNDVRGESIAVVAEEIRGEPGSTVQLGVERPVSGAELEFELVRSEIALDSVVQIEMLSDGIGYLLIRQFIDDTAEELVDAINGLEAEGMTSLIVDLRGNPGGRLEVCARMTEFFLDEGQTILTVQSRREEEEVFSASRQDYHFEGEVIVLIDEGSASASEIFAGALRDHNRAVLVGQKSFGKGSVQSVYEFPGGDGLKLTSARYLLPGGEAIHGSGVVPNISVEISVQDTFLRILQRNHLRNMSVLEFEAVFGFTPVEDESLNIAKVILTKGRRG